VKIKEGMVEVPLPGRTMPAYVARPQGEGPYAAVIVLMEAFGLNAHIKNIASRFAAEGYVSVAPDLYHRQGGAAVEYLSDIVPRIAFDVDAAKSGQNQP